MSYVKLARLPENIADFRAADDPGNETRARLQALARVYNECQPGNAVKRRFYEGHIRLSEVNLGLALPQGMANLEIGCAWGEKAVDVLAARSMFDGFVGEDGETAETMSGITEANNLLSEYDKAKRNELTYGCAFATLSADDVRGCRIAWHSPETAAALWDDEAGRLGCGLAIMGVRRRSDSYRTLEPSVIAYYDERATWIMRRSERNVWIAERTPHKMGVPLMVPLVWNATAAKPFGRSRLKEPIRNLIKGYVRTMADATIALEFSTAPQKYVLGLTDEQYDVITGDKFRAYVGSILAATQNPETGEKPTVGQLSQGSLEPHITQLRALSTQFSAATGLTVTDVGVVNDANPTSSDAILAQSQTLVLMAEQLNAGNGYALKNIALLAQAIARGVTPEELTAAEKSVIPHFKNPAMPSVAVTADAAVKIATARPGFAETDTFLEMVGFSQADIRRIRGQEARTRGNTILAELEE